MLSFAEFRKETLIVEAIKYIDKILFKNIVNGKYEMSKAELKKWENDQRIIKEDNEKEYLNNEEEIELIKKFQADPTSKEGLDAQAKLVENKMPYIYSKVGKFIRMNWEYANKKDDMVQEACLALMKAIENFDTNSGNIFTAYAKKCIVGALLNYNNTNRRRSIDNLKGDVGMISSIDSTISGDRGEWADKDSKLSDVIPDERSGADIVGTLEDDERRAALADWISQLPQAEATAINMYFYPEPGQKPATLAQIGQKIGMTAMGVKKLLDRVVLKLRKFADDAGFND